MKIGQFLNIPFEFFNTNKEKWFYVSSSSIFLMLFVLVYQPFGIYEVLKNSRYNIVELLLLLLFFSCVIFLVLAFSQFVLRKQFLVKNYTIKYFLKWFFVDVLLIVCVTTIIDYFVFEEDVITIDNIMKEMFFYSFLTYFSLCIVLLYPVMGILVYTYLKQLLSDKVTLEKDLTVIKEHYKIASGNEDLIKVLDENDVCKLTVAINTIYAIESQNQYILIKYLKNGRLIEQSVRTRFSKILNELKDFPSLIKCHRSYAVNLMNIESLKYLNQKPNLILGSPEMIKIPVSKTYLKDIKTKISLY
ncbi:LytTR family DNA-binding domain-containing protein [Tenacibaculum aiptasiae]|uniref:LytTR family DNA-binding domain-containing protein n=1 Tax=Tenacibaculum aiptasiae TaxID=426481 RepID=UPI00232BE307|nr:LytTR family DNA-binding domain-containing protein [Tenacibaculum aiptasiae]